MQIQYTDYYDILGVDRDATTKDIKQAYRILAHQYHPDVSKRLDAEERFKEINEAYRILKNPKKRARFDILQKKIESEWSFPNSFKTVKTETASKFDFPLMCWFLAAIFAVIMFSTILREFVTPVVICLLVYLILEDMEMGLTVPIWVVLIVIILATFGIFLQILAVPVMLVFVFYLAIKKLLA
jgi:hypothetical protein